MQRCGVNLVLSGDKHVPYAWRLEDIFVVNTGTTCSLRLRGTIKPCYTILTIGPGQGDGHSQVPVPWSRGHPHFAVDLRT